MTLPRLQPIAPTWRKEPFDDPDWLFDFKYDGFRALCYIEQRRNRLISRNNNIMARFDALADQGAATLIGRRMIGMGRAGHVRLVRLLPRMSDDACRRH